MSDMTAEQRSVEFVKLATLAAMQLGAIQAAIESGNLELLKSGSEFSLKIKEGILEQVPMDIQLEVLMDIMSAVSEQ